MTSERIKAVGESTPPLSIGFDIAIAMCRRADVLGHPYPSPELRVWLANQITIAVNAARSSSATPDGVIKERGEDGRDPSGQAAQQSLSPDGLGPSGEHPSRITLDGIEDLFRQLAAHPDAEEQDTVLFTEAADRLREYRPEARRIIAEDIGRWSSWSEDDCDSDPSDPLASYVTEWFVGFWRNGAPEADSAVCIGSRPGAERIARDLALELNEMVSLADRARDQRAEREDGGSRPRPEAASPVVDANSGGEAPGGEIPEGWGQVSSVLSRNYWHVILRHRGNKGLVKGTSLVSYEAAFQDAVAKALSAPRPSQREG